MENIAAILLATQLQSFIAMVLINFSDNKKEAIPAFGGLRHTIKYYF